MTDSTSLTINDLSIATGAASQADSGSDLQAIVDSETLKQGKKPYRSPHTPGFPDGFKPCMPGKVLRYFQSAVQTDGTNIAAINYWPSDAAVAVLLKISKRRLYEWAEKYPELRQAMDEGHAVAEAILHRGALTEKFNPSYSKFLATNAYGMKSESTESTANVNANISGGITVRFIDSTSSI